MLFIILMILIIFACVWRIACFEETDKSINDFWWLLTGKDW